MIFKIRVGWWLGYNLDFHGSHFGFYLHDGTEDEHIGHVGVNGGPCEGLITGNWYHVAAVRDTTEGTLKLYVNGVERDSVVDTTGDVSCTRNLIIGKRYEGDTDYTEDPIEPFIGALDEVAIFNRALTDCEICGMYTNGLAGQDYTVTDPPLVDFPDPDLKAAVEEALGITDPTECDMLCLTELDGNSRGIVDLTGLEYATNLRILFLADNNIADISPLSGLTNLENLSLSENQISDISPLSGLINLEILHMVFNQLYDITPLSGLSNLTELLLFQNQIDSVQPLAGLTNLRELGLDTNQIIDISHLSGLINLEYLNIGGNPITDITPLSGLTNLKILWLGDNPIDDSDIPDLAGLTNLVFLDIRYNGISNIASLSTLTNLKELWLCYNPIGSIEVLSELTNLTGLWMEYSQISDLEPLSELMHLEYLILWGNPLGWEAYCTYIPIILYNNPGLELHVDENPYDCENPPIPVHFEDPHLKAVVEETLGVTDPTSCDMLNLTELNGTWRGIADLTGLEYAQNLVVLDLGVNQISDISPLSGLTELVVLELNYNQISNINTLSGLVNLEGLVLINNQISDIAVLSNLTSLTGLWLGGNQINDIGPLSNLMNLQELWLDGNPLGFDAFCMYYPLIKANNPGIVLSPDPPVGIDCSIVNDPVVFGDPALKAAVEMELEIYDPTPFDMLFLEELDAHERGIVDLTGLEYAINLHATDLVGNQISDLAPLAELTELRWLGLDNNIINDISALANLTNLQDLILHHNQISDLMPVEGLTNLHVLDIKVNQISNIAPVSNLTNLEALELGGNQISNIEPLSGLTNLRELYLWGNQISDIDSLEYMTNLTHLWLNGNQISNIEILSGLTNLERMLLNGNKISDIEPLSGLTKLILLNLSFNQINDITALSGLTNLTELNLFINQISDIEPISELMNLEFLDLRWNPLNCEAYLTYIPMIEDNNPGIEFRHGSTPPQCLNQPPVATIIGPYSGLVNSVGFPIELTGLIEDPDEGDTHTAIWTISNENWTEDLIIESIILEPGNIVFNENIFTEAGIYSIKLTVTDSFGESDETSVVNSDTESPAFIVVYNPDGGFVTGGGWIYSPVGALLDSPAEGKASFGFVAKYKKGATIPEGNTEFRFQAGDFKFKSDSYEWLVVAGTKAMFKGEGSIDNCEGTHKFILTAVDDDDKKGDAFRIKIWNPQTDVVVYDNKRGEDDEAEPTIIGGGSIVIHKN